LAKIKKGEIFLNGPRRPQAKKGFWGRLEKKIKGGRPIILFSLQTKTKTNWKREKKGKKGKKKKKKKREGKKNKIFARPPQSKNPPFKPFLAFFGAQKKN